MESWLERLPLVTEGYEARDIWNYDETGLFWKALPDKGLAEKKKAYNGGNKSKLRVIIAFLLIPLGNLSALMYKSWMNNGILSEILGRINRKLVQNEKSILLMMDNADVTHMILMGSLAILKLLKMV